MAGRIRTTKKLAQRIDRSYFRKLFPLALWRRVLSVAAVGIGLAWLGFHAMAHDRTPYSSGPLTKPHANLGQDCAKCHGEGFAPGTRITDAACLACHGGPAHNAQQTFAPACAECHVEHRNVEQLMDASGRTCAGCHADLQTKTGRPDVAAHIGNFAHDHPEFAALREGASDPAAIKFSHWKHVKIGARLTCDQCHRPTGVDGAWKYGHAPPVPPPPMAPTISRGRIAPRALMQPVNYYEQCSGCHQLTFDDRMPDLAAPHDKPEAVDGFVTQNLRQYIAGHPAELGKGGAPGSAAAWVAWRASDDEKQLWATTCERCHDMQTAAGARLPTVPETKINRRWFAEAEFDHSAHDKLQCISCHVNAPFSDKASEVLLPGIELCRECHGAGIQNASADCSTCHLYHAWNKTQPLEAQFNKRP